MAIEMVVDEGVPSSELPTEKQLAEAIMTVCRMVGFDVSVDVCIRFSTDEAMREANRRWRGKDSVTDVLSFPMQEPPYQPNQPLGDIMMAWPRLCRDAVERHVPPYAHACHLAIHGALHLLGYTHNNEMDTERMQTCERKAMRDLGLHDPYDHE